MVLLRRSRGALCLGSLLALSLACEAVKEGPIRYDLAQKCISIAALESGKILQRSGGEYSFGDDDDAERFFVKPTSLGTFLLSDRRGELLSRERKKISPMDQADANAEWAIVSVSVDHEGFDDHSLVSLKSIVDDKRLVFSKDEPKLRADGIADMVDAGFRIKIHPDADCKSYPEADLNAKRLAPFFDNEDVGHESLVGFADMHTHIGFPKALGSVAMSGGTFHRYGVTHALKECSLLHGDDGSRDLLESQYSSDGSGGHKTTGYPHFEYWPNRQTNTHITAYYRWVERAYLSGLRLMVTHVTGNPSYCQVLGILNFKEKEGECKSDSRVELQTKYIYDMQDYIDAQMGGPDQGWFRVVRSAAEAREVVANNKLAVVLGSEYGTLFDCKRDDGSCDENYIESKLDELYRLGVRSVFPIHRFDNAFGGTRPGSGTGGSWMHLTSKLSTSDLDHILEFVDPTKHLFQPIGGNYYDLDYCPEGISGTSDVKSMQKFVDEDFAFIMKELESLPVIGNLASKFLNFAVIEKLKPLPTYDQFDGGLGSCNQRPLLDAGRALIKGMARRAMILEVDHMSYPTLIDTLNLLEEMSYPAVVSSHGWMEDHVDLRKRIFKLGGLVSPYNKQPSQIASILKQYASEQESVGRDFIGVGIGTDIQGVATQAKGDDEFQPEYPFKSFDSTVEFYSPQTGHRSFDFKQEGIAHYGLLAEWVENLRQVDERDSGESLQILMNSAEAYIRMWESAELHAKYIQ